MSQLSSMHFWEKLQIICKLIWSCNGIRENRPRAIFDEVYPIFKARIIEKEFGHNAIGLIFKNGTLIWLAGTTWTACADYLEMHAEFDRERLIGILTNEIQKALDDISDEDKRKQSLEEFEDYRILCNDCNTRYGLFSEHISAPVGKRKRTEEH